MKNYLVIFAVLLTNYCLGQADIKHRIIPTGHYLGLKYIEISPDGKYLLSVSSSDALLWEVSSGKPLWSYKVPSKLPGDKAVFSPDGHHILTGSISPSHVGVIANVWDIITKKVVTEITSEKAYGSDLCYSKDGKLIGTSGVNGKVQLWDATTGSLKFSFQAALGADDIHILSDGHSVFLCHYGGEIWDSKTGIKTAEMRTEDKFPSHIHGCVSPDEKWFLVSTQQNLTLFDASTHEFYRQFKGHTGEVKAIAFSPDNRTFASGSADGTLKLWDALTGKKILDISSGIPIGTDDMEEINKFFAGVNGFVSAVCFSPDGKIVYAGLGNRSIKAYDVASGKLLKIFAGSEMTMEYVAFDPERSEISVRELGTNRVKQFNFKTGMVGNSTYSDHLKMTQYGLKTNKFYFSVLGHESLKIYDQADKFLGGIYFLGEKDWYFYNKEREFECSPGAYNYIFDLQGLEISKVSPSDPKHHPGIMAMIFQK